MQNKLQRLFIYKPIICTIAIIVITVCTVTKTNASQTSQSDYFSTKSSNSAETSLSYAKKPSWVVNSTDYEPDRPPIGRSLFDYVVTKKTNGKREYDVPFPFPKLVEKIETMVQRDNSQSSPVKRLLVPLGRSLARNIARPDFFKFPRVVAAVDTQPVHETGESGILLKDKIYVGYGEKSNILEVISYNEAAGRFEFQVVKNYQKNAAPEVFYTKREVCISCHQNRSVIFSRQTWGETNANPNIAALLNLENKSFYNIPINSGFDTANAIDNATNRANFILVNNMLWKKACALPGKENGPDAASCRAQLLRFAMQFLLSNQYYYDSKSLEISSDLKNKIRNIWQMRWPNGLLIPDSDIPNRDPLIERTNSTHLRKLSRKVDLITIKVIEDMLSKSIIPTQFEPLKPRPPLDLWTADKDDIVHNIIIGFNQYFSQIELLKIDKHLYQTAIQNNKIAQKSRFKCQFHQRKISNTKTSIAFECNTSIQKMNDIAFLRGRIYQENSKFTDGKISQINILDNTYTNINITLKTEPTSQRPNSSNLITYIPFRGNFHARLANGNAIQQVKLSLPNNLSDNFSGHLDLVVLDDFSKLATSINNMNKEYQNGLNDIFSEKPIRRSTTMKSLFTHLEMPSINWCCENTDDMPEIAFDTFVKDPTKKVLTVQNLDPETKPFYLFCGQCHRNNSNIDLNFMSGNNKSVKHNIAQCAERIYFRISLWDKDKPNNDITNVSKHAAMPPLNTLHELGLSTTKWRNSYTLHQIKYYVKNIIESNATSPETILSRDYNELQQCISSQNSE